MSEAIGQRPMQGFRYNAGIGYLAIPTDIDRDKYISLCLKNFRVSIWTEDGGFINQVPIGIEDLNFAEFPDTPKKLGSPVVYVTEQIHNQPIIVRVLNRNEDMPDLVEGQFKFKRKYQNSFVELVGSAKDGYLGITVDSDKNSQFYVNVRNKNKSAKVNFEIAGDTSFYTTGQTSIQQSKKFVLKTFDSENEDNYSSFEQTQTRNEFSNKKFIINGQDEPFVLGNTFKKLFDEFIDEVAKTTVTTAMGQMPIINAIQVAAFKERTKTILSTVGYIDK